MTEHNDEFYTSMDVRLDRFSTFANIFAWIILVFYILEAVSQYYQISRLGGYQGFLPTLANGFQSVVALFGHDPASAMNYLLDIINILWEGVMYWFLLKGVSLGLNMIVETDLNYREQLEDKNNE